MKKLERYEVRPNVMADAPPFEVVWVNVIGLTERMEFHSLSAAQLWVEQMQFYSASCDDLEAN